MRAGRATAHLRRKAAQRWIKSISTAFSAGGWADLMLGVASANAVTSSMTPEQMTLRKIRSMTSTLALAVPCHIEPRRYQYLVHAGTLSKSGNVSNASRNISALGPSSSFFSEGLVSTEIVGACE